MLGTWGPASWEARAGDSRRFDDGPKPHTPFQWAAQATREEILHKVALLQAGMRDRGLRFSWHDPESTHVEGLLSRGDRRVGRVILEAWKRGARFDAWSEHLRWDVWVAAAEAGASTSPFTRPGRDLHEILPWDHVDVGVARWHLAASGATHLSRLSKERWGKVTRRDPRDPQRFRRPAEGGAAGATPPGTAGRTDVHPRSAYATGRAPIAECLLPSWNSLIRSGSWRSL